MPHLKNLESPHGYVMELRIKKVGNQIDCQLFQINVLLLYLQSMKLQLFYMHQAQPLQGLLK